MSPLYYVTGGAQKRDNAMMLNCVRSQTDGFRLYGRIGSISDDFTAGGPIDAPDCIPAGCMDSVTFRCGPWHLNDGNGRAKPAITTIARES